MIDLRYVKKLIEMLDGSSVDSIEISSDKGLKIRLAKTPSGRSAGTVASVTPAQGVSDVSRATPVMGMPVIAEAPAPAPPPPAAAPPAQKLHEMKAPMVGTYYSAPEPGAKPYVSVGSKVKKGQVLCIIEAMK
ncbi:MAG TPA: biotin/lipoyl-containing protein, partial [Gemmatimonadaceae bacterium]|nr:biotin/lipoyl-containing protein [Gemmatimonadaceae bacterium]